MFKVKQGDVFLANLSDATGSEQAFANRVGHESVKITYRYAHMFPSKDKAIADKLTDFRGGAFNE